MSLLSQLEAFVAEGKIAKAAKPQKRKAKKPVDPNIAKKYIAPGERRIPGERHGFRESVAPPVPKPTMYQEKRVIYNDRFLLPVMIKYAPEELEKATYNSFAFLGCSPIWKQHLHLPNEE